MTATKTTAYTFAPDSMTCKGKTFPVEYALQPSGTVTAFVQLDDRRVRVRFDEGAAEYPAARAARFRACRNAQKRNRYRSHGGFLSFAFSGARIRHRF